MAKIRHKITKHTTQEVTLDQNNAFKAQKHGNSETPNTTGNIDPG